MTIRKTTLTLALTSLFALGGTALAQDYGGAGAAPPPAYGETTPGSAALTEQTVDTFVDAFIAVQQIREDFAERLQSASDEHEAQTMQQEAQHEMMRAVEESGMSVQEYNEVAIALQDDPELMQQVQEKAADRM
ncbi:putative conserved secreted protein [Thioalkalivibrio nitratireducens DSM 14787]|uniref:Conserved secreted protein n=1 Tax=Thioalkalivibrio nitratireducens (strain DSM 14787 / UNIQEM 213 / ALEN2) TaxID=1255043 RepID=L0E2E7_THIND|nr:DUF4168 domain-containing protein [Thioalkalivibrio nitratireducens]AGA34826.1 putative conserved secreted protein [Thioalkalivibrio nitratireducens DSM 14787]